MKKLSKLALAFAAAATATGLFAGCSTVRESSPPSVDTSTIAYSQDARTGLCFAVKTSDMSHGFKAASLANVDCSNTVMTQITDTPASAPVYGYDDVSQACLAEVSSRAAYGFTVRAITAVPCTPQVQRLIH